jgi:hypothetical protein
MIYFEQLLTSNYLEGSSTNMLLIIQIFISSRFNFKPIKILFPYFLFCFALFFFSFFFKFWFLFVC